MANAEMPELNKRVQIVINDTTGGNVSKFADIIEISQQKINRIFKPDTRTEKYPTVPADILISIIEKFVNYDPDWLFTGKGQKFRAQNVGYDHLFPGYDKTKSAGKSNKENDNKNDNDNDTKPNVQKNVSLKIVDTTLDDLVTAKVHSIISDVYTELKGEIQELKMSVLFSTLDEQEAKLMEQEEGKDEGERGENVS